MRSSLLCAIGLSLALAAWSAFAEEASVTKADVKADVAVDMKRAADIAKVRVDDQAVEWLGEKYPYQATLNEIYMTVPTEKRVGRIADYLSAKALTKGGGFPLITRYDVADFNWEYIKNKTQYASVKLESPEAVELREVIEANGTKYQFAKTLAKLEPGTVILLPNLMSNASVAPVTVEFEMGRDQVFWTGAPDEGMMRIAYAGTNRGCKVDVASRPREAKIYFNGIEWYRLTNTSVIRQAGPVTVTIKKEKFKPWTETRTLRAGASWTIDARLVNE